VFPRLFIAATVVNSENDKKTNRNEILLEQEVEKIRRLELKQ
jgi:hypothetical protein